MIATMLRYLTPTAWAIVLGMALAAAALVAVVSWRSAEQDLRKAHAAAIMSDSRAGSGAAAIGTVVDNAAKADAIATQVRASQDAIRNAPDNQRDGVTLRELCKLPGNGHNAACTVL